MKSDMKEEMSEPSGSVENSPNDMDSAMGSMPSLTSLGGGKLSHKSHGISKGKCPKGMCPSKGRLPKSKGKH